MKFKSKQFISRFMAVVLSVCMLMCSFEIVFSFIGIKSETVFAKDNTDDRIINLHFLDKSVDYESIRVWLYGNKINESQYNFSFRDDNDYIVSVISVPFDEEKISFFVEFDIDDSYSECDLQHSFCFNNNDSDIYDVYFKNGEDSFEVKKGQENYPFFVDKGLCGKNNNIHYTLDLNGLLHISGEGDMDNYSGYDYYEYYHYSPFGYNQRIKKVKIDSGVTSIGDYAFYYCTNLESFDISDSVLKVGKRALTGTKWLDNQTDGLSYLGKIAYKYFNKSKSSKSINIELLDETVAINEDAFSHCNLNEIIIPNSVKRIGNHAFSYCSIKSVKLPNGLTQISYGLFDCSSLQNIELPESIQYIGGYSFRDCYISSIQIPEKVTYIGEGAFEGCEQLKDIYIPDTTEEIGEYAFRDTQWFSDQPSGVVYAGKVAYDYKYSYDGSILGDTIELKNDTVGIAGGAFYDCDFLKTVILPDGIKIVNDSSFYSCSNLSDIRIPKNVRKIGEFAFAYCSKLKRITIETSKDGIDIEPYAFVDCKELESINMPNTVNQIGEAAFRGCANLIDVYYSGTKEQWSKMKINASNNYTLTGATIHYDSIITELIDSSSSNYVIVNGFNWVGAKFCFQTNQKEMTKAEADTIVDGITWIVSDPQVIQIQDVSHDIYKNVKGTAIDIYLDIKAMKPGKVTITGTTADGISASATIYAEPEISLFQSTSSSGAKNDFFNCQVKLNYDDKDYLEQFVKTLTVSGENVNSQIGDIHISKESYGWLAKFDITAIGTGKTECTVRSPGGQFNTKSIDIDDDRHYSTIYEMKQGTLSGGILESVDSDGKKVTINGVNYAVNENTVVSAKDILANKNLEDKAVIACSDNDVITSIESVYDVMKPAVFLEVKDEPFIFTGGSYNKLSSEMMMTISINPDPTYNYQDLKKLGLSVSIKTAILSSYNGKINFGKKFLLNQTSVTDEMDGEKVLRLGEKLVRTYTVNIDKNYVPENVITRADFDISVTIKGLKNQQKLYAWFDIGNLDKQNEAAKTQHQTINQEAGNELKDSLNKLDKTNICTLSGLGDVFSAKDVQKIQNFLCVYVAEMMAVPTVEESGFFEKIADKAKSKLKSEMYKAFGIKEELLPQNKTQQVTVSVAAYTKENKIAVIDFSIDVDSHILSGREYGRLCHVSYTYRDVSVLPKYAQHSGEGQIATYNLKAFAESILDYVKYSYMECWGKNANTIVAMFQAAPLDILFDGNFSSHLFDMTKKIVKVSTGEIKEEDLIKEEGKRIANKTYEHIKKTVIKCPVDVYVYDSDNRIVAAIINNTVQKEYQGVYCNVIGDEKYIYLSEDNYSLKLIGNGDGLMEYCIEEYTGEVLSRTVSVKDVPLTGNKVYESFVPHISYIDSKVYDLISDTDEVISISDDSLINLAIKGDTNGDGKATIADSLMIARYEVKLRTLTDEQLAVSDVNYDGKVTIADALKIARYEVKLINSL